MNLDELVSPQVAAGCFPGRSLARKKILLASAAADLSGLLQAALFGPDDNTAPLIDLDQWAEADTVFVDKIFLDGKCER